MNNSSSSIRVSSDTRRRIAELARRTGAGSQQGVIQRALDKLEQQLFWEGFDEEATAYLKAHPGERTERDRYGRIAGDALKGRG